MNQTPLPASIPSLLGNVIPGRHVRINAASGIPKSPVVSVPAGSEAHGRPRVTLVKNGETVSGIRVECSCGEVIELDCHY
jgi:hypothetical protein